MEGQLAVSLGHVCYTETLFFLSVYMNFIKGWALIIPKGALRHPHVSRHLPVFPKGQSLVGHMIPTGRS